MISFTRLLSLIVVTLFLFAEEAAAQQAVVITGKLTNAETGEGIEGIVILCKECSRSAQSEKGGIYRFKTPRLSKMTLEFRLLGYEVLEKKLGASDWEKTRHDTLLLDLSLHPKPISSPVVTITSHKADTVFGTLKFFVEDFEFYGDQFILLTFENNLKKAKVKWTDEHQKIISSIDIPDEAVELYKDFQGYINVICKEKIYRLRFVDDHLVLASLPVDQFKTEIMPCSDTCKGHIYFSNYTRDYPAFSWFSYTIRDTTVKKLKYVKDKELLESYEEAFDFLKPRDRLNARKMEMQTGIDKRIIAAEMTGFPHTLFYTPVYAPLFVTRDTVYVFDHYLDKMYRFEPFGKMLDSFPINYHHPKEWKEWKHKLIQDRTTRSIYAILLKGGYYVLKEIDLHSGKIIAEHKLNFQYANHLKARNGYVYYVYRPFESGQTKFLYKEQLPE